MYKPVSCSRFHWVWIQVVKAEVVLMPHEAFAHDVGNLQSISWELIVVDERNRMRGAKHGPSLAALGALQPRHQVIISQGRALEVGSNPSLLAMFFFLGLWVLKRVGRKRKRWRVAMRYAVMVR
jgi:hypothetical protein